MNDIFSNLYFYAVFIPPPPLFFNRDLGTFSKEQVATLKGVMSCNLGCYSNDER